MYMYEVDMLVYMTVTERKSKRHYRMFDSDYLYSTVLECKINTIP